MKASEGSGMGEGMSRKGLWLVVAICLVCGVFFRFYNLEKKVFWYDEIHSKLWATGHSWSEVRDSVPAVEAPVRTLHRFLRIESDRGPQRVIESVARDDPQHTPLYYLLAHLWLRTFGDSVPAIRSLSVLAGLLLLPCIYWLCGELGLGRRTAYTAVALVAVSPFYVIYSQEARQYGLWAVEVLLASCLLLRAVTSGRGRDWIFYGLSLVAGLYTHLLFAPVIAAHAVYVCACFIRPERRTDRGATPVLFFSGAAFLAFLAFVPWCFYLIRNISQATGNLGWSQQKVGLLSLACMWGFNYSSLFVDLNHSVRFIEQYDVPLFLDYTFRAGVLVVLSAGLTFLARRVSHRPRIFLLALIVIPFLTLAVPDLLMGGMRSGGGHRYLIPSYLGVTIAVAALLGEGVSSPSSRERRCRWLLGVLLCSGIVSLVAHASADTWWTKPVSYYAPRVARIVNQSPHPLLISDVSVNLLSMSYLLEPSVRVLPVRNPDLLHIPAGFRDIFVFAPSQTLFARIRAERGFTLIELDRRGRLWLLRSDIRSRDG